MKFKYAYGIAPGTSVGEQEAKSQDKVRTFDENGVAGICLVGPAGKAENSVFQLELVAEAAASLLKGRFDELYASEEEIIKKTILEDLGEAVWGFEMALSDMDCSLQFAAVKGDRYLAGHMGGGMIARFEGGCSVLSEPENDLIREGTDLTLEEQALAMLRIYQGELREPSGFMLLSDGACQSLYNFSTGTLSPACGTFFEWLKEYDEETVSEALADNIDKYFLKKTKGDISVAVMVSDEGLPETDEQDDTPEDVQTKEGKPVRENGKNRKMLKYLIALVLVLAVIAVYLLMARDGGNQKDAVNPGSEQTPSALTGSAIDEPSVTFAVENPKSYDAGEYKVGVDIPAGEYFFWTGEMLQPGSILVNDDTALSGELYSMTIRLNEYDTLVTDYRFTAAENVNPVKPTDGILISGKYKIGKDIAPGMYTIKPANENAEGRYYSILDEEISNDTKFKDETKVVVPEEGYTVFYNAVLLVD